MTILFINNTQLLHKANCQFKVKIGYSKIFGSTATFLNEKQDELFKFYHLL
jgi:hypothetical protein